MTDRTNELGQPIGADVPDWAPPPPPGDSALAGRFCRVERLDPEKHARELFDANALDAEGRNWTYLPYGPFETFERYAAWLKRDCTGDDPKFYAVIDGTTGKATGVASYLRVEPEAGSIEVGHINFSPLLQRSRAATEAMYLMMTNVFALGYRRYEWKCDALNALSRRAAVRLGFTLEGVFRQATVYKGRNRDTAWYAMIGGEWPFLKDAFEGWLDPANFDSAGVQRRCLSDMTAKALTDASEAQG